ncbi:hypothetical protein EDB85DRAFT_2145932 [Lactarius pseudohatsudake]|nr:hypothetical protein EDB85DRAFT_2145932 [Lactarius pseudohatsudake]
MAERPHDWVIEDSEEEDQLCATELDPVPPAEDGVSSIQAFTSTVVESAEEISRISSLDRALPAQHTLPSIPPQEEHSTISEYSTKSGPKPRPRPIFGHPNTNPVASTSTSDPILPFTLAPEHREQPTTVTRSDPTGVESVSENTLAPIDFSQDIAERAKMRTRKAAKRSMQHTEDVIDITDDELAIAPARKPKERPKPRPVKRAVPSRDCPPLPSDPVTLPVPSSSMSLPPSDPFPESTVINFTPPPPGLDEVAASTSSPRGDSARKRKRQRPGRLQSPMDDPTDSRPLLTAPGRASSPLSDPPPPARGSGTIPDISHEVKSNEKDTDDEYGAEQSTKRHRNTKGTEDSTNASPGRSEIDKSKKKSIVEVVILSPKKKNKRTKATSSDEDDELLLAPQSNSSAATKSHKGKKRAITLRSEDSPSTEVGSSSKGMAMGEEEHEHQRAAPMPHIDADDKTMSRSVELTTPAPLKENLLPSVSVGGKDPPQSSSMRETPDRGKLRYTLSGLGRKTPMQELIRRAASHPHTPFSATSSPVASPLAKTSKSALRRIAPLHTTRRTPPPPPPPPPPPKKSKKMLNLEEKWELELEDEVEGWWALTDEERRDWRKAKRDKELGFDD